MKYLLNSAVMTAPGNYTYSNCTLEYAIGWLQEGGFESAIGYQETADVLAEISGVAIPVSRTQVRMGHGDEALVFRLNLRPDADSKGKLSAEFVREHGEFSIIEFSTPHCACGEEVRWIEFDEDSETLRGFWGTECQACKDKSENHDDQMLHPLNFQASDYPDYTGGEEEEV